MSLQSINVSAATFKGLCRTCLSKEIELLSVFELCWGTTTFESIIASITGIKIKQEDALPTTICKECKDKVSNAYNFKIRAQQSESALHKVLERGSQEIDINAFKALEVEQSNVKTEQLDPDIQDGYTDVDISLAFGDAEESYNVDIVKNEPVNSVIENSNENSIKSLKKEEFYDIDKDSSYCPMCCQMFPDADALTDHAWQLHTDLMGPRKRGRKKRLTSTILYKLTENGLNMKNLKLKCPFCTENFKTKDDFVIHTTEHKDEKVIGCMLCKKIYLKKKDFDGHVCLQRRTDLVSKEAHPPDRTDERKLYTEMRLQDILMKNVSNKDPACIVSVCESCRCVFGTEAELNRHRDREHPELSVRCHLCDKVFASLKSASRHRAVCERVERLFACSSCELRFTHEVTLNKHILRVHAGQSVSLHFLDRDRDRTAQSYKCEICARPFTRKDLLERHTRSHKTGEKIFECDTCKKKFTRRENLRAHLRIHEGKTTYADSAACLCLYCGRSFSNSSNFIVHMRRHTGEKPYKCDFCGKGFCRSSDLQCHRRSHTGEKPCVCRECGKAFSRSNKLSRHMRVHTGVKPYKCPYCEKAFAQSNDLTVHVRRHTGDKPYVCEMCGDRFIQGTALHAHRRTHGHYPQPMDQQPPPLLYGIQSDTMTHCHTQT